MDGRSEDAVRRPQNRLIQLRISQQPLEPVVLRLQFSQAFRLVHIKASVFLLPSVIGVVGHASRLSTHRRWSCLGSAALPPPAASESPPPRSYFSPFPCPFLPPMQHFHWTHFWGAGQRSGRNEMMIDIHHPPMHLYYESLLGNLYR